MKQLVAFDLDGTLAASKQPLDDDMAASLGRLLGVVRVAIISGGDWPQFETQVVARMPKDADLSRFFILPATGTKLYRYDGGWQQVYAEIFDANERKAILDALEAGVKSAGLDQGKSWGERIEDRGSQVTFSALGQQAPLDAKEAWDPDRAKRTQLQKELREKLPDLAINIGGSTSIDITRKGIDKAYGLKKLSAETGVPLEAMLFMGDAIYPGGNDNPAFELGLDVVRVKSVDATRAAIDAVIGCCKITA